MHEHQQPQGDNSTIFPVYSRSARAPPQLRRVFTRDLDGLPHLLSTAVDTESPAPSIRKRNPGLHPVYHHINDFIQAKADEGTHALVPERARVQADREALSGVAHLCGTITI